jgi:hypothetical protein
MARRIIVGSQFQDLKATEFNGIDQYAFVDDPTWKADTQGAFYWWYRPTTVLSSMANQTIVGYGVRDAANNSMLRFLQRWNSDASIASPYRNQPIPDVFGNTTHNGTTLRTYGNHIFTAATWGLLGIESNGAQWTWTWNGVSIGGTAWQGSVNNGRWLGNISGTAHRLAVGCAFLSNAPISYNNNRTNELLYFRRPLTTAERTALYNGGTPTNPRRVVPVADIGSHWRMGESRDNSTTIFDEIGSNNLTLVNMSSAQYVNV